MDENDINNFSQKKMVWGKSTILGPNIFHRHNYASAVRNFLNFAQ